MIVGFSLQNVNAERTGTPQGQLNVNYNHNVTGVEEANVTAFDEAVARISFEFAITYQQNGEDAAAISFDGHVLWQRNADDLIEQWDDNGTLDEQVSATVANHIFRKCLTQAVGLADSLELPSPVPMPKIGGQ